MVCCFCWCVSGKEVEWAFIWLRSVVLQSWRLQLICEISDRLIVITECRTHGRVKTLLIRYWLFSSKSKTRSAGAQLKKGRACSNWAEGASFLLPCLSKHLRWMTRWRVIRQLQHCMFTSQFEATDLTGERVVLHTHCNHWYRICRCWYDSEGGVGVRGITDLLIWCNVVVCKNPHTVFYSGNFNCLWVSVVACCWPAMVAVLDPSSVCPLSE